VVTPTRFFFFFSSRRRHTRWPRDWSSDVCSSDLIGFRPLKRKNIGAFAVDLEARGGDVNRLHTKSGDGYDGDHGKQKRKDQPLRSEERRVGKEWRSGWRRGEGIGTDRKGRK